MAASPTPTNPLQPADPFVLVKEPPANAPLLGATSGAFTSVALGPGMVLSGGTLTLALIGSGSTAVGLGGAALLNVGTVSGTVADGGALTAEIAARSAAVSAEVSARQSGVLSQVILSGGTIGTASDGAVVVTAGGTATLLRAASGAGQLGPVGFSSPPNAGLPFLAFTDPLGFVAPYGPGVRPPSAVQADGLPGGFSTTTIADARLPFLVVSDPLGFLGPFGPGVRSPASQADSLAGGISVRLVADARLPGVLFSDALGFVGAIPAGAAAAGGGYSALEVLQLDTAALVQAQAVRGQTNTTAQRPVFGYNLCVWYGQSEMQGWQSVPAVITTAKYDNLMLGTATRPQGLGTQAAYTPVGNTLLNPLKSVNQLVAGGANGALFTPKNAHADNLAGVTVDATARTITTTSAVDFTAIFAVGDTIVCTGFTVAVGNNNLQLTVTARTATSITVSQTTMVSTSSAEDGIGIVWTDQTNRGEESSVAALNTWRRMQLDMRGLAADSTRQLVAGNCCVGGQAIAALSKGASPELFNRMRDLATGVKTRATADGKTVGHVLTAFCQGGTDAINGTLKSVYKPALAQLASDIVSDIANGIMGQGRPPFFVMFQVSSRNISDTDGMGVPMAQLELAGLSLASGYGAPITPDVYVAGPGYQVTDGSAGIHWDNNGEVFNGTMLGKILHRLIDRNEGWKPVHPTSIVVRGTTILATFHVPQPPLQFQPYYDFQTAKFPADRGFTVLDDVGRVGVASVALVGRATVAITLTRALSTNPVLRYGDATYHQGGGCLCDSDPMTSEEVYQYVLGSGQLPAANIPALIGKPFSLWNYSVVFSLPISAS